MLESDEDAVRDEEDGMTSASCGAQKSPIMWCTVSTVIYCVSIIKKRKKTQMAVDRF